MRQPLVWLLAVAIVVIAMVSGADDAQAQRTYCDQLRSRKAFLVSRYQKYRARYFRCRRAGWSRSSCRTFRRRYKRFRRSYRRARFKFRKYNCSRYFTWDAPTWGNRPQGHYQRAKCQQLAQRVARYRQVRSRYLSRWQRCKWRRGHYSPRCQRLRNKVNQWYGRVRIARGHYRTWNCHFTWNTWNDPWAHRRRQRQRVRYQQAKCQQLARRVARYRRTRRIYLSRWQRCKWRRGSYSRRCRRLRRRVSQWYARVRTARSHYSSWGCHFNWNSWSDPWRNVQPSQPSHHNPPGDEE